MACRAENISAKVEESMTVKKKKKSNTAKNPKGRLVTRLLSFTLTDEEKSARGLEAANLNHKVAEKTIEKKIAVDEFSAMIKDLTARRNTLLNQIKTGTEKRDVECTEVKNFDANKVEYWFDGEKLEERDMTTFDRQLELEEQKGALKKAEKKSEAHAGATVVPPKEAASDVKDVIREETSRKSKNSAVDGARA